MPSFKLNFTGLCVFVPKYDIDDPMHKDHNEMKVLLVDSSESMGHSHMDIPHADDLHLPLLVCPYENVAPGSRPVDATFFATEKLDSLKRSMAVFCLDDQDLNVVPAAENQLRIDNSEEARGCPLREQPTSFSWVAPLERISPGSEVVRPSCLGDRNVDSVIVGRVRLTEGELRTFRIAVGYDYQMLNWEFRVPGERRTVEHRQAIADTVQFETAFRDRLELRTKLLRQSRNPRISEVFKDRQELPIYLKAVDGADVVAWVKNMPWPDASGTRRGPALYRQPDYHFSHVYKVSHSHSKPNIPFPYELCQFRDVRHNGNPNCPPPRAAAEYGKRRGQADTEDEG